MEKYSSQPAWPVNVFARKGSRDRAHSGPCSVMDGLTAVKYWFISSAGGGGSRRAWQNDETVARRRSFLPLTELSMNVGLVVVLGCNSSSYRQE